jgi:Zn finger protein HypA/HybF involved in hydrogenase expression
MNSDQDQATRPDENSETSANLNTKEEPMLYCPCCNTRLISRKCKLICEQCGYYMGCADYY